MLPALAPCSNQWRARDQVRRILVLKQHPEAEHGVGVARVSSLLPPVAGCGQVGRVLQREHSAEADHGYGVACVGGLQVPVASAGQIRGILDLQQDCEAGHGVGVAAEAAWWCQGRAAARSGGSSPSSSCPSRVMASGIAGLGGLLVPLAGGGQVGRILVPQ